MTILPTLYGRYLPIDHKGFILNDRQREAIQPEWKEILDDLIATVLQNHSNVHSIYIRGSVADGRAIKGLSDIDGMAVLDISPASSDAKQPMLNCPWLKRANDMLKVKYPFCDGIETYLIPLPMVINDRRTGFYIQSQSLCIWGNDLTKSISPYKLGEPATYSHAPNLAYDVQYIKSKLTQDDSPSFVATCCKKIMKRIVRSGMELCMEADQSYTRDLYLSNEMFSRHYPDNAYRMELALHLALNPLTDKMALLDAIDCTGGWLSRQIATHFPVDERHVSFIDDFGFDDALMPTPPPIPRCAQAPSHFMGPALKNI